MGCTSRGCKHLLRSLLAILCALIIAFSPAMISPQATHAQLPGDLNGDGQVDILDLIILKMALAGVRSPGDNFDLTGSGKINALDLDKLMSMIVPQSAAPASGGGGGGGGGGALPIIPTPTATPTPSPTPICLPCMLTTSGIVLDADTSLPIQNALVHLFNSEDSATTLTDQDGTFFVDFPVCYDCSGTIEVSADGYNSYTGEASENMQVMLSPISAPTPTPTVTPTPTPTSTPSWYCNLSVFSDGCCPIDVTGAITDTVPAGETREYTLPSGSSITLIANDTDPGCNFEYWSSFLSPPSTTNPKTLTCAIMSPDIDFFTPVLYTAKCSIATPTPTPTPPPNGEPDAITNLAIHSYEYNSIRLTWTAPDNGSGGAVDSYEIRRSGSAITDGNWDSATVCTVSYANQGTPRDPGQTETGTVTGLDRQTQYYFAIKSEAGGQVSPISTTSPSETTRQSDLAESNWWLWQIYYNSEDGTENTTYQINNVRAVNQTVLVNYSVLDNPGTGFTDYGYSPCAIIDWNVDDLLYDCSNPARARRVPTGLQGFLVPYRFDRTIYDLEAFVASDDPTLWIKATQISAEFNTTVGMGDGDIPTVMLFSYQDAGIPAVTSNPPGISDGYPFIIGKADWPQWKWQLDSASTYTISGYDYEYEHGFNWHVASFNASYDVAANCQSPNATGIFDATYLYFTNTYWRIYTSGPATGGVRTPSSNKVELWYSEEVKNFVRKLDKMTYFGREDWGIVKYESRDFGTSDFDVTDRTGNMDVTITITNTLDYAADFNILLLIMDLDANTPDCTGGNNAIYLNGKTVFPTMSSIDSINSAIQNTGTLNPGDSVTLTWTDVYTSDGGTYTVWCGGEQVSW